MQELPLAIHVWGVGMGRRDGGTATRQSAGRRERSRSLRRLQTPGPAPTPSSAAVARCSRAGFPRPRNTVQCIASAI